MARKGVYNKIFTIFSTIAIIAELCFIIYLICSKRINSQILISNISGILFFIGLILFYNFYNKKILFYLGYLFVLINIIIYIIKMFKSPKIPGAIYLLSCVYMFVIMAKYLYSTNDDILLKIFFLKKRINYRKAWVHYENKRYEESIEILKTLKGIKSLYLLAVNYEDSKNYDLAIETYTQIIALDKHERPDILYNRGTVYDIIGKKGKAIIDFENCIKCNKPDPKAFIALGVMLDESGNFERAKELFVKGNALDNSFGKYIPGKYK